MDAGLAQGISGKRPSQQSVKVVAGEALQLFAPAATGRRGLVASIS
jgi:hypothetical protein